MVWLCPEKGQKQVRPDGSRSTAHPEREHTRGQGFLPHIFLALFTTGFIDLSQVPNISNEAAVGL